MVPNAPRDTWAAACLTQSCRCTTRGGQVEHVASDEHERQKCVAHASARACMCVLAVYISECAFACMCRRGLNMNVWLVAYAAPQLTTPTWSRLPLQRWATSSACLRRPVSAACNV